MYTKTKRFSCFLLCFILLFMGFAGVLTAPARAEPITIATVSTLIWILGLMGISFASVEVARQASETIMWNAPDIMDMIDALPQGGGGDPPDPSAPNHKLLFNALSSANLLIIMDRLKSLFSSDEDSELELPSTDYTSPDLPNLKMKIMAEGFDYNNFYPTFSQCDYIYPLQNLNEWGWQTAFIFYSIVNPDGTSFVYKIKGGVGEKILYTENCAPAYGHEFRKSNTEPIILYSANEYQNGTLGVGWLAYPYGTDYYLKPYFSIRYTDSAGKLVEIPVKFNSSINRAYKITGIPQLGVVQVPYKTDIEYTVPQIGEALRQKIAKDGDMVVTIPHATEDTVKKTQDEIAISIEIRDLLEEIKNGGITPPPEDGDIDIDDFKMPQSLIYKFPFCVPFDLIALVSALAAEPVPPRWVFPISYPSFDFYYELEFDLTRFDMVAQVIRWAVIISFIYMLIIQTRKLIKG